MPKLSLLKLITATDLGRPFRMLISVFICAVILSAFMNILMLTSPIFMMQIFDRVLTGRHLETLILLTLIAAAALMTFGGLDWARNQLMARIGASIQRDLAPRVLKASIQNRIRTGADGGQAMRDLGTVRQLLGGKTLFPFLDAPWSLIFFILLWLIHPWMGIYAVICAVTLMLCAILSNLASRSLNRKTQKEQMAAQHWVDLAVNESEAISALGMQSSLVQRYLDRLHKLHDGLHRSENRIEIIGSGARTLRQMAQIGIMTVAAYLLLQDELSQGVVIASSILLARALAPMELMITQWQPLLNGLSALKRVMQLLAGYRDDAEKTCPPTPKTRLGIQQMGLRKPDRQGGFLLRDINIKAERPEIFGIMGPSGAGKTCLCRALAGVAVPELGEIRLDGARLDQWPADDLGRHIGYMPQDVGLPPASVAETIARLSQDPDMDKVYAVAQRVEAHDFIMQLPNGYDTRIGAEGFPLSGGQRQRIGLARALYGDPVMIVLDEPDAHLDTESAQILARVIHAEKQRGAIIFLVSHRPAMLQVTDKLIIMSDGCVTKQGNSREILTELKNRSIPPKPELDQTAPSRKSAPAKKTVPA
ncbi:type I secretion system permease/ATPase [Aestuariispira insulae]|uniref:ATP-binding cassette subfamily C protein/ATP-binding cassette subfamily C protein EexD n=1 Tax=Aestuariispira insulae TaxID=1461337 RepID=A0A3D9H1G1_9PROT|nr:type I secretion system permease/ATPase [Aestuariispira insulae]RED43349.1 ATP-binding cassette subfamily C protein/ATP-binding cassette subfamily C protein EexD [Aestuariispira insulae]